VGPRERYVGGGWANYGGGGDSEWASSFWSVSTYLVVPVAFMRVVRLPTVSWVKVVRKQSLEGECAVARVEVEVRSEAMRLGHCP